MARMRLLATADLHYDHSKGSALADELIDRMNAERDVDALLLVGDTATPTGDALERCLRRFTFAGPKLFVAGNHELWTIGSDSYDLLHDVLPRRVRALGWHWLQDEPFVDAGRGVAVVGSVGWYDYSFAQASLAIPERFYAAKVSPGAAERLEEFHALMEQADDVPPAARKVCARWNDGKFVKLHRSDKAFLDELLSHLRDQLATLSQVPAVVAAIHNLPFRELLPPPRNAQWDFAKAYLGSERLGQLLLEFPNVKHAICGHSHLAMEAQVGHVHAINIGSGYRAKAYRVIEVL